MNKWWCFIAVLMCVACGNQEGNSQSVESGSKEDRIQFSIDQKNKESARISSYVERRNWEMVETGSGLRYMIYQKNGKDTIVTGNEVTFSYKVELLDGTLCYTSDSLGLKTVRVAQSEAESGLHEGFTYLSTGDKAKIIIPSHLAFGLTGDYDRIPSMATLVYDVEILAVK